MAVVERAMLDARILTATAAIWLLAVGGLALTRWYAEAVYMPGGQAVVAPPVEHCAGALVATMAAAAGLPGKEPPDDLC